MTLRLVFKGFGVSYFLVSLRLILDKCTMILPFYFAGLSDPVRYITRKLINTRVAKLIFWNLQLPLQFSTGSICYQYPSKNSSVPIAVKCSFPENLCFKFAANYKQVTIQGCISADQCRQFDDQHLHCCEGDLCNSSKYNGYRKR